MISNPGYLLKSFLLYQISQIKKECSFNKVFDPIVDDLVVDIKMTSSVLVCSIMKQTKLRMSKRTIAGTAEGWKIWRKTIIINYLFLFVLFSIILKFREGWAPLSHQVPTVLFWMQQSCINALVIQQILDYCHPPLKK